MNGSCVIEYARLSKSISSRSLFQQLNLRVQTGECVILSGENGEGKTTLLRIMSGLNRPDSGECQYDGRRCSWRRARPWLLRNVVYLHQETYMFDASVEDNIAYGLRRRGVGAKPARAAALDALGRFGLAHLQQRSARQLSGGERQRVALLRAWVLLPRLLLLDEPTASMDERARHCTLFLIKWLLQEAVSLVISAHEPRLFAPLATRHIRLQQGKLMTGPALTANHNDPLSASGDLHDGQRYQS